MTQVAGSTAAPATGAGASAASATTSGTTSQCLASASLYVGDLHPEVTEALLFEVFNNIGPVASIRVCRDSITRRSLGYAYVNYHSVNDAERAIEVNNYYPFFGRQCRLMWSHRDPSLRKSGLGNIYVKNLDKTIDNKALYDTFSIFGNILSCKVAMDSKGQSLGFGFVHYENEESAKAAISRVNGMMIGEQKVEVQPFIRRNERTTNREAKFTNLYVKNFPKEWTEETLKTLFEKYGEITSTALRADKLLRPYGFVNYKEPHMARDAITALHERIGTPEGRILATEEEEEYIKKQEEAKELAKKEEELRKEQEKKDGVEEEKDEKDKEGEDKKEETEDGEKKEKESDEKKSEGDNKPEDDQDDGKEKKVGDEYRLYVQRAQKRTERMQLLRQQFETQERRQRPTGVNLYVKNLDDSIDDEELRRVFELENCEGVVSTKVMRDDKGGSKRFGFVTFSTPQDATNAVTRMRMKLVHGKPLYVALAEEREVRSRRLRERYANPIRNSGMGGPSVVPPQFNFNVGQGFYGPAHMQQAPHAMGRAGGMGMMSNGQVAPGGAVAWRANPRPYPPQAMPGQYPPNHMGGMMQGPMGGMRGGRPRQMMTHQIPGHMAPKQPGGMVMRNVPMGQPQAGMAAQNFKYTPQVRNRVDFSSQPHHIASQPMMQQNNPLPHQELMLPSDRLTPQILAAAPPNLQKQMLGERLFPMIQQHEGKLAGKITGMMLEMDNSELLALLDSEEQLRAKVEEALTVLRQHQGGADSSQM